MSNLRDKRDEPVALREQVLGWLEVRRTDRQLV